MSYAVVRYEMRRGPRALLEPAEEWFKPNFATLEEAEAAKARRLKRAGPLPPGVTYAVEELPTLSEEAEHARRQFFGSLAGHLGRAVTDEERRAFCGSLIGKRYPVSRQRFWESRKWIGIRDYLEAHLLEECPGGEACPHWQEALGMLGQVPEEERVAA